VLYIKYNIAAPKYASQNYVGSTTKTVKDYFRLELLQSSPQSSVDSGNKMLI